METHRRDTIIAFDLDDVLCVRDKDHEHLGPKKYERCRPIPEMIKIVNQCYDAGYYIKVYTARGMAQFKGNVAQTYDHIFTLTKTQLKEWGIKHHELILGKTHYHLLVDDKALSSFRVSKFEDIVERLP